MNKVYKVEDTEPGSINSNQYVLLGYRNEEGEIFYIGEDKSYTTNNKDEAYFAKWSDARNITEDILLALIPGNLKVTDYLIMYTDVYRVVGYMKENNGEYHLNITNTLNEINMVLHKEKRNHKNEDIDLVIEKYFPETDEWYNIETGLTHDEELISKDLVSVVNRFTQLPQHHPSHQDDMCNAIHVVQRLLQSRTCHRLYPDRYPLYPKKKGDDK